MSRAVIFWLGILMVFAGGTIIWFGTKYAGRQVGSEAVAELSVAMRPRYHFVGTEGQWYQRPPHRQGARCAHVCRLLAMAKVQEDKKQKCVLAR